MKHYLLPLLLTSAAFAHSLDDRVEALEKEMEEVSARNPEGTLGASFASARPDMVDSNWYVNFDLTYWHVKMGGTDYAYSVQNLSSTNSTSLPIDGDVKTNDFSWDYGIKAGLGYKSSHDGWDLYARYTWYQTDDSSKSFKSPPSGLYSLTSISAIPTSHAKSHVEIGYNNVDLELARSYATSGRLSLRPHFDLKSAWIDIDQNTTFTASGVLATDGVGGLDYKVKQRETFWGLGPRFGVDTMWDLKRGFTLFGDFSIATLYGKFNTTFREFAPGPLPGIFPTDLSGRVVKVRDKFHRFAPFAQMFLGLGYERYINDCKQHIGLKLGYEVQYYWRLNQLHGSVNSTNFTPPLQVFNSTKVDFDNNGEDLMFYGLTASLRLDF